MASKFSIFVLTLVISAVVSQAAPMEKYVERDLQSLSDYEDPEFVLAMLNRLLHSRGMDTLMHPNMKRALDLGMGRGFSGSQAAKHLMGLHAATWAGGPGRRKRSSNGDVSAMEVESAGIQEAGEGTMKRR